MSNKTVNATEASALAKIGLMPEFAIIEKMVEAKEHNLGIQLLKDRESDPVKRKENGDIAYGEISALRKLIYQIKDAVKNSEDEEDEEDV